ncbi:radical SAM protein [Photobacterium sp. GJ3]|uniref:radical SAM protein n=1 Tax=Photobacterium sp. GJ3 TaxID=2829502 RepID=UPI001B8D075A|nr:radical SAM protein [Photobacterium sp. GJ3]QUJ66957.1 radical SAM protein [Photobacterium sp. GJ3]
MSEQKETQVFPPPYRPKKWSATPLADMRNTLKRLGLWHHNQQLGRRWAVGCVALEITQRCNLDCSLCYLSEHSQAVQDIPLEEIKRRIDAIYTWYGEGTDVQVTGGDPTLRDPDELELIVRWIAEKKMRPTLMTNGIRASRALLTKLCEAGLVDVAFHVDTTQGYKKYPDEVSLNQLRARYLERVAGLPLTVMFNTTIHPGNIKQIPDLMHFFARHAQQIRTVSFQLEADTGRGVHSVENQLSRDTVLALINSACASPLNYQAAEIGHPDCNRYALTLVVNGKIWNFYDDSALTGDVLRHSTALLWHRNQPLRSMLGFMKWLCFNPKLAVRLTRWALKKAWQMRRDLFACRGKISTLSVFTHSFMPGDCLDCERVEACSFMTMTRDGPVSMCVLNAERDRYIYQPVQLSSGKWWSPTNDGNVHYMEAAAPQVLRWVPEEQLPTRLLKGKARNRRLAKGVRDTSS